MFLAHLPRVSCAVLCAAFLLPAPAALATPVTVDLKIGEAMLANSSDAGELAALRVFAGIGSLELSSRVEVDKNNTATAASGLASTWILTDPAQPGYFALKFGIGNLDVSADTFFFQNIGDLSQLVWTNDQVQFLSGGPCAANQNKCNIGRLSHYTTTPAAPVKTEQGNGGQTGGGSAGGVEAGSGETGGGSIGGGQAGGGVSEGGVETGAQEGSNQEQHEVPEPGSLALLAMGALAVYGARRRTA